MRANQSYSKKFLIVLIGCLFHRWDFKWHSKKKLTVECLRMGGAPSFLMALLRRSRACQNLWSLNWKSDRFFLLYLICPFTLCIFFLQILFMSLLPIFVHSQPRIVLMFNFVLSSSSQPHICSLIFSVVKFFSVVRQKWTNGQECSRIKCHAPISSLFIFKLNSLFFSLLLLHKHELL